MWKGDEGKPIDNSKKLRPSVSQLQGNDFYNNLGEHESKFILYLVSIREPSPGQHFDCSLAESIANS